MRASKGNPCDPPKSTFRLLARRPPASQPTLSQPWRRTTMTRPGPRTGSLAEERQRQVSRRAGDLKEAPERAVEFQYQEDRAGNRGGGNDEANENRGVALREQAEAQEDRRGPADEHDQHGRGQYVPAPLGNDDPADLRQRADGFKGSPLEPLLGLCFRRKRKDQFFYLLDGPLDVRAPRFGWAEILRR